MSPSELIATTSLALELAGTAVIALTAAGATVIAIGRLPRGMRGAGEPYSWYRRTLGRGILLGLELLVAADIIGTVAIEPTFTNVGILALIVLVRTFLSFTLELEISGRWPWQARPGDAEAPQR